MNNKWKLDSIGTKDGKPAIVWWRYGVASAGEPSIVNRAQTYESVAERDAELIL